MRRVIPALLLLLLFVACSSQPVTNDSSVGDSPPSTAEALPTSTIAPTTTPAARVTVTSTPPATPAIDAETTATTIDYALIIDESQKSLFDLSEPPPIRDDVRLASAYRGPFPAATPVGAVPEYRVGDVETFFVGNVDDNTVRTITAELMSIGERAYFWFDSGEGGITPDAARLAEATTAFDEIFATLYEYFGVDPIEGGRAHIVHASPMTLCASAANCRLAGYFSPRDLLPATVNPSSNERPMFVMNAWQFQSVYYLDTLSHELRHMLGSDYDASDEDWFVEGAAMLAEDLVGFSSSPQSRGNLFLTNTDQQLNSWTNGNTIPHYGQGYLVNRYLFDRLGPELYREYSFSPVAGLAAVDEIARRHDLDMTGESLWLDWLVAMALIPDPDNPETTREIPEKYRWLGPELAPVIGVSVNTMPATYDTDVGQYAAEYYFLPSSGTVQLDFSGTDTVSLLGSSPPSGDSMWYARRANFSNPHLTRAFDLREVSTATLEYQVYADIEQGYDFAYVAASTDGGETWTALTAENMQGLDAGDDPSDSAFSDRFYTGQIGRWLPERIDLTPYAGQEILLRFEYVTDPILTYGGFAVTGIAIPEIDFIDTDDEPDNGWIAEGFVRTKGELAQQWNLQLVTFDLDGKPTVEILPISPDGRLQYSYQAHPGSANPMLIVAATAPETLERASYRLEIGSQ